VARERAGGMFAFQRIDYSGVFSVSYINNPLRYRRRQAIINLLYFRVSVLSGSTGTENINEYLFCLEHGRECFMFARSTLGSEI
jgi:hypothetical protein